MRPGFLELSWFTPKSMVSGEGAVDNWQFGFGDGMTDGDQTTFPNIEPIGVAAYGMIP
jgi:hypothetical protein